MTRTAQERDVTQVNPQWYTLLAGPIIWTVYFLVSYSLAEFGCRGGWLAGTLAGLPAASVVVVALTLVALAVSGLATYRTFRRWQRSQGDPNGDKGWFQVEDRHRFMVLAGLLLDVLFTFLILLSGIPALMLIPCQSY